MFETHGNKANSLIHNASKTCVKQSQKTPFLMRKNGLKWVLSQPLKNYGK